MNDGWFPQSLHFWSRGERDSEPRKMREAAMLLPDDGRRDAIGGRKSLRLSLL
jgi:hypothetical protein